MRRTAVALALALTAAAAGAGTAVAAPEAPAQPCPAVPADRVDDAVGRLPQAFPDVPWRVTGTGASVDCALNWVQVDPEGATGSSPTHILLFDHFKYGSTATEKPTAFTSVVGSEAPGQITVSFRWLNPGDPTANPTGQANVRYELSPQAPPHAIDPIPPQVIN
ncbi:putative lipoprotein LppP [Nocardia nova SH22a]|uniref:Putative lipoprotein LppP n=1 Tax=Nocardia nova SH22a TaxID=1415166 RepID=W5TIW1_9NOCA|nr:LppP/LprE family lipoprotein [Nocardia nova]AHH19104.1 putative lipoprotein LppP [Nocardia nova SH22a]